MKLFYKISFGLIIAGLVLMGAGAAICVCEINSFQYMGNKYGLEPVITQKEIVLPDNLAKIYYSFYDVEVEADESLTGNNAVFQTSYTANHQIEYDIKINDNRYLKNEYTGNYSKYTVNEVNIERNDHYSNENQGFGELKSILNDLKNRKIYSYNNVEEVQTKLLVSPEAYERFSLYPEGYSVLSYGDYMSDMIARENSEDNYEYDEDYYDSEVYNEQSYDEYVYPEE